MAYQIKRTDEEIDTLRNQCAEGIDAGSKYPGMNLTAHGGKTTMNHATNPAAYYPQQTAAPRRTRRVFLWVFLTIQVLFIVWLIAGLATKNPSVAGQVSSFCGNRGWFPLYKSQADCMSSYGRTLNDATDTGKGLGVALVVIFWVIVDFLVGGGYAIYRLASRRRYA